MQTKELMIQLAKDQIVSWGNKLDASNIDEVTTAIDSQLKLLHSIQETFFLPLHHDLTPMQEIEETEEDKESRKESQNDKTVTLFCEKVAKVNEQNNTNAHVEHEVIEPQKLEEENVDDGAIIRGYFTQKIRGGTVHKRQQIFVPEGVVRRLDLKTGDFIECVQYGIKGKRAQYNFNVVQRTDKVPPKKREEVSCLIIKRHEDLNRLYVEVKDEKQDFEVPILISDTDIGNYHLSEGDIITYAHEIGCVQQGCVIWKHKIEEILPEKVKTPHPKEVERKEAQKEIKKARRYKPIFEGLNILMVGGTYHGLHKTIQPEIEKRAGSLKYLVGDEKEATIKSHIKKADIVVVFTESISHDGMWKAKRYIKEYNKVHTFTKNMGPEVFVRRTSILKKKLMTNDAIPA